MATLRIRELREIQVLRIGLVQMRCEKAAIDDNLAAMSRYLEEAASRGVHILGFPEMSLTGYADPTRYPKAILTLDGPEQLLEMTRDSSATVLGGLIESNPSGKPFITQVVLRGGDLLGFYRKMTIEDEETEWFSRGEGVPVFCHGKTVFGMAICADIGNRDVFAECARQRAAVIFELAAPGLYGEQATRNWESGYKWWQEECQKHLSKHARTCGVWVAVATQAGRTIDEDFPGGAYVFSPSGERVYATRDGSEGGVYLGIDLETSAVTEL